MGVLISISDQIVSLPVDEKVIGPVITRRLLFDLRKLREGLGSQDLKVGVRRLQKPLDGLEVALNKEVDVAPVTSREQLVKGFQADVDHLLVLGAAPGDVPADLFGQVLADPIQLLRGRHAVIGQGILQGQKLVKTGFFVRNRKFPIFASSDFGRKTLFKS